MKKSYFYSAALLSAAAVVIAPTAEASFIDVKSGTEQEKAIKSLVDRQIVSGYTDGTFKPSNQVTRAQAAKILAGVLKLDTDNITDPNFSDVPKTHPNYKYIAALANAGIISGSNGKYRPNDPVRRGQMAKILVNAFGVKSASKLEFPFTDVIGTGYHDYVEALYENQITTGKSATIFGVNDVVTRGQLAVFIYRVEQLVNAEKVTYTAEQFGYTYVNAGIVDTYSDYAIKISAGMSNDYDYENVKVSPRSVGTDYFYIGEFNPDSDGGYIGGLHYYKADVVEVNGKLQMTIEELEEPVYDPGAFYIGEDTFTELTYVDGTPVEEELYTVWEDDEFGSALEIFVEGDFFLYVESADGEVDERAIQVNYYGPTTAENEGVYVEDQLVIAGEALEDLIGDGIVKNVMVEPYLDINDNPVTPAISAQWITEGIVMQVIGEGISVLKIELENGEVLEEYIFSTRFGNGYLLN